MFAGLSCVTGKNIRMSGWLSGVGHVERRQRDPGVRVIARLARGRSVTPSDLLAGIEATLDLKPATLEFGAVAVGSG